MTLEGSIPELIRKKQVRDFISLCNGEAAFSSEDVIGFYIKRKEVLAGNDYREYQGS